MAQITDITSYISDKYKAEAKAIEDEAKAKYDAHIAKAKAEAENEYDAIITQANADAARRLEMAESSARQTEAKAALKVKNESVENILAKAKAKILGMDDKDYEAILVSLLKKYHEGKKGEIILSKADDKRKLASLETEAKALGLEISNQKAEISGGFILKYGSVEENCSIDAVFKEKKEELTDYINSNLFK